MDYERSISSLEAAAARQSPDLSAFLHLVLIDDQRAKWTEEQARRERGEGWWPDSAAG